MSPAPRLQVPGKKTQAIFVLPQPQSEACFFHVSNSFTRAIGISNMSSKPYSCLHCTCSATIVGVYSTPCSSISMLSRGLLVCYNESFCFMVSKWRLGQPHWLLWVLLLSILLGQSSVHKLGHVDLHHDYFSFEFPELHAKCCSFMSQILLSVLV